MLYKEIFRQKVFPSDEDTLKYNHEYLHKNKNKIIAEKMQYFKYSLSRITENSVVGIVKRIKRIVKNEHNALRTLNTKIDDVKYDLYHYHIDTYYAHVKCDYLWMECHMAGIFLKFITKEIYEMSMGKFIRVACKIDFNYINRLIKNLKECEKYIDEVIQRYCYK